MASKATKILLKDRADYESERPFWQDIEEIMTSRVLDDSAGYLNGSMTGESWLVYLQGLKDEILDRLAAYRTEAEHDGFCASTLGPYREEKLKIERGYLRNLAVLYRNAEKSYKILSG